jgi:hypothetical protein
MSDEAKIGIVAVLVSYVGIIVAAGIGLASLRVAWRTDQRVEVLLFDQMRSEALRSILATKVLLIKQQTSAESVNFRARMLLAGQLQAEQRVAIQTATGLLDKDLESIADAIKGSSELAEEAKSYALPTKGRPTSKEIRDANLMLESLRNANAEEQVLLATFDGSIAKAQDMMGVRLDVAE